MSNTEETAERLTQAKELGVRIAIDDFGTGYSSLAYLQRFPVDALKIDRSFISRMGQDPEGETLIRTLVQLGKSLAIETLAEGIEQSCELSLLREESCDSGQGFLFARPLDGGRLRARSCATGSARAPAWTRSARAPAWTRLARAPAWTPSCNDRSFGVACFGFTEPDAVCCRRGVSSLYRSLLTSRVFGVMFCPVHDFPRWEVGAQ